MSKFKVGDRIVRVRPDGVHFFGTVNSINLTRKRLPIRCIMSNGEYWTFNENQIELATEVQEAVFGD